MSVDDHAKVDVIRFYDQEAERESEQYTDGLTQIELYPANSFRLDIILDRMRAIGANRVLDVGCGTAQPMLRMLQSGFDVTGFDFSPKMVEGAKRTLADGGQDPDHVQIGDLEADATLPEGPFDAIVATGVFPHNLDDVAAYGNIAKRLAPGAAAFIEYRNSLMSLFSINKFSHDFFWYELLRGDELPEPLRAEAMAFLDRKFETEMVRMGRSREITFSQILAKFHNPLTLDGQLRGYGLALGDVHYYHFHAAPPHLEKPHKQAFWEQSLKLERTGDWRGMFMCSAFVAEIVAATCSE